jgi:hypothetical protein
MKAIATIVVAGGVTSISFTKDTVRGGGFCCYVGTSQCNGYYVKFEGGKLSSELFQSCHFDRINDIAFPQGYSEVFATCGTTDIRVWQMNKTRELLRITVPNLICNCVAFMPDGGSFCINYYTPFQMNINSQNKTFVLLK